MAINPYSKYQEQSVMTMTHGEMLAKLYEETIKQINGGMNAIKSKDFEMANLCLQKAQKIIAYLRATLDMKYDVSANLSSLYVFFNEQICKANIKKDVKLLEEVLPMVEELKDTFIQADKLARMEKTPNASTMGTSASIMVG